MPTGLGLWADRIEAVVDRVAGSKLASLLVIIAVALLCILPGFSTIPPVDRDEPRFAQATHQMVETGDYLDIRFQDQTRYKKPIGIYWAQSAAVALTGTGPDAPIWVYRLPSLIGAIAAACLTWWLTLAFGRPRAALLAGALLAATVLLGVEGRLAKTDGLLLATIVAAHGALARAWLADGERRRWGLAAIFWTALGIGALIKGPVILLAIVPPVLLVSVREGSFGWLRRLAPLPGLVWLVAIVAPWLVAIAITSGGTFFEQSLGKDFLAKAASAQESHGAPPGYYALLFFVTCWPVAGLFGTSLPWLLDQLRRPVVLYGTFAALPLWIVFEALPTKLPHYVLPAYPLIAMLVGTALDEGGTRFRGWFGRLASWGPAIMPAIMVVVSIVVAALLKEQASIAGVVLLLGAIAIGVFAARLLPVAPIAGAVVAIMAAIVTYAGVWDAVLPHIEATRTSERLVAAGKAVAGCSNPAFASAGYEEPSLVLLAGTRTALGDGILTANFLRDGAATRACRLAFVERRELDAFNNRIDDLGLTVKELDRVAGYNISSGRRLDIYIYRLVQP